MSSERQAQPSPGPKRLVDPPLDFPPYRATALRHPRQPLVVIPQTLSDVSGPMFGGSAVRQLDHDLTRQHPGQPIGERIVVEGRILDEDGSPVPGALIEVWQANAAGRYAHRGDQHDAPLDPNFSGAGRTLAGPDGRYRFLTIKPGAYPWLNHPNAWRPAHIHFSLFGIGMVQRLVTQMYFPGDPLLALDPIYQSVPDDAGRRRMVAAFALEATVPETALGYRFDIVLRGRTATPMTG